MCKLNPDFGTKRCPVTGPLRKKLAPGLSRRKSMATKIRKIATWTYCMAFKLVRVADRLDPPCVDNLAREIFKNNFEKIVPFNNVRH